MANSIALPKEYTTNLDEVYKLAALTADLEGDKEDAKLGANGREITVPVLTMDGLSDYSRSSGYTSGGVTLTYETLPLNYERGKKLSVDYIDNEQSAGVAFGKLDAEFIRTKVVPEHDAFVFSTLASETGISTTTGAALSTGADVVAAIRAGVNKMDEDEVPYESRILYITPTLYGLVEDLDTTKSKAVLSQFSKIVKVPQSRFYTSITLADGSFSKTASTGKNINFMIVEKSAVLDFMVRKVGNIISPEDNQSADAYILKRRESGLVKVYPQKAAGIYLHKAA